MPWDNFKKEHDRWLVPVIACLVLVGATMWASVLIPEEQTPLSVPTEATQPTFPAQILKTWGGRLARFCADSDTPDEIYDVAVASLPAEVQAELAVGILVSSEEELVSLLENFTS